MSKTNDVILPHEVNDGMTLRDRYENLVQAPQVLQCRALKHNVLLIS